MFLSFNSICFFLFVLLFFFFKQKPAYEMRISDWSSYVCSSDLFRDLFSKGFAFDKLAGNVRIAAGKASTDDLLIDGPAAEIRIHGNADLRAQTFNQTIEVLPRAGNLLAEIGSASCRERVCQYV